MVLIFLCDFSVWKKRFVLNFEKNTCFRQKRNDIDFDSRNLSLALTFSWKRSFQRRERDETKSESDKHKPTKSHNRKRCENYHFLSSYFAVWPQNSKLSCLNCMIIVTHKYVKKEFMGNKKSSSSSNKNMSAERRIFVMRHGERVDFTFNDWLVECFDKQGNYFRRDLNLPKRLPKRKEGFRGFAYDSPLTVMGTVQAFLVGEAMRDNEISFDQVYCSPSLRCVQTCHHVLKGLGALSVPINIEPGKLRNMNKIQRWISKYFFILKPKLG